MNSMEEMLYQVLLPCCTNMIHCTCILCNIFFFINCLFWMSQLIILNCDFSCHSYLQTWALSGKHAISRHQRALIFINKFLRNLANPPECQVIFFLLKWEINSFNKNMENQSDDYMGALVVLSWKNMFWWWEILCLPFSSVLLLNVFWTFSAVVWLCVCVCGSILMCRQPLQKKDCINEMLKIRTKSFNCVFVMPCGAKVQETELINCDRMKLLCWNNYM